MKKLKGKALDPSMFYSEELTGVDGVKTVFTLSYTPIGNSAVLIFVDGKIIFQKSGADGVVVSGTSVTLGQAPGTGQDVVAFYVKK